MDNIEHCTTWILSMSFNLAAAKQGHTLLLKQPTHMFPLLLRLDNADTATTRDAQGRGGPRTLSILPPSSDTRNGFTAFFA